MKIRTHSAAETRAVAATLAGALRAGDLVVLSGDLGGGKTTFVQGAASALGVTEPVTSPTFAIVQEYAGSCGVLHADIYRLETVQELFDIGFEEMIDDDVIVFVEWGERALAALPERYCEVRFEFPPESDDDRIVAISWHGSNAPERSRAVATALAHHLHPEAG